MFSAHTIGSVDNILITSPQTRVSSYVPRTTHTYVNFFASGFNLRLSDTEDSISFTLLETFLVGYRRSTKVLEDPR